MEDTGIYMQSCNCMEYGLVLDNNNRTSIKNTRNAKAIVITTFNPVQHTTETSHDEKYFASVKTKNMYIKKYKSPEHYFMTTF